MEKLIEALQIFKKYQNNDFPTMCDHDILYIAGITKEEVSKEDQERLYFLNFEWEEEGGYWYSTTYGSA